MSKIVAIEHVTLDGVMQGPGRPGEDRRDGFDQGGWGMAGNDPLMQEIAGRRMGSAWSLLAGRVTYQQFERFWPKQPPNPFTEAFNKVQKFVVSRTLKEPLGWRGSTLLEGDAAQLVGKLKNERTDTLVIFGSGVLVRSLMARDLVDELVLQIHPLVLGGGRRLFSDGSVVAKLRLLDAVTTGTGVIVATYQRR